MDMYGMLGNNAPNIGMNNKIGHSLLIAPFVTLTALLTLYWCVSVVCVNLEFFYILKWRL